MLAGDERIDPRRAREVVERPTETALREALAQADLLGDVREGLVQHRR
jgi:hypothetical protein